MNPAACRSSAVSCTAFSIRLPVAGFDLVDDFFERAAFRLGIDLSPVQLEQVTGQLTQALEFTGADVGSLAFQETEHEEPTVVAVGRQQDSGTAALSAARNPNTLFQYAATDFAIDQPLRNLLGRRQQCCVAQAGPERPTIERLCLEYSPPTHTVSLGKPVVELVI
jgi:hypothetical protein